ncbi:MAG: 50S ribosomal protein L21 [Leptotrichiaceae bacterium]|jgi:large subunit ribosomal protein L21|nr:50S ribosomal protein L21 [Leptotrichiaceae bacterium]MBP6168295.1 50S ribosomal protein L21 [Leptotrichiaceae bacterium]MBP7026365.1 50S ribosomal protein L21 [Leptotrichiaceae bacterium]MBP8637027.1 50S ribosomal protein L21 [Leptotrichiaceae bacterium]MBP9539149.1 50S ribosomal protein L21 [Leptotrichiaceae bacterium]
MFAVIKTGGKQYKVEKGSVIKVEKLAADVDSDVEMKEVLMVGEGDNVKFGTPFVTTASVIATVKEHGKGEKKINFKYNKKTYYRKKGHRQLFTTIEIKSIKG